MENKKKFENFCSTHILSIGFVSAILLWVVVYSIIAYCHHKRVIESQNRIIKIYEQQTIQSRGQTSQYNNKFFWLQQEKQEDQEKIYQEIKSLLDLEFNRVQNEFETFEIWAGVLTIIFLIFSFYSLFKTESFERQGEKALDSIKQIKDEAASKIHEIDTDKESRLSKMDTDFEKWKSEKNQMYDSALSKQGEAIENSISDKYRQSFNKFIEGLQADSNQKLLAQIDNISEEIKKLIQQYDKQFNEKMAEIKKRLNGLNDSEIMTEEDIDAIIEEHDQEENKHDEESDKPLN